MAAFSSRDRDAFMAHWARIMRSGTGSSTPSSRTGPWRAMSSIGKRRGSRTSATGSARVIGEGDRQCGPGPVPDHDRGAAGLRARGKAQRRFDPGLQKCGFQLARADPGEGETRRRACAGAALEMRPPVDRRGFLGSSTRVRRRLLPALATQEKVRFRGEADGRKFFLFCFAHDPRNLGVDRGRCAMGFPGLSAGPLGIGVPAAILGAVESRPRPPRCWMMSRVARVQAATCCSSRPERSRQR